MASKTFFVNVRFPGPLYKRLHEDKTKASKIVREAVAVWLDYFKMDEKRILFKEDQNYIVLGKLGSGKTRLMKTILPMLTRRKIIIDPNKEYSNLGTVYAVKREKQEQETEKEAVLERFWAKQEARRIRDLCDTEKGSIVIQPEFKEKETEKQFLIEYFSSLMDRVEKKPELLVIENASEYEEHILPIISAGQKKNIQVIVVSQFPLNNKILNNTTPIIGQFWSDLLKNTNLPTPISNACRLLKPNEWVWLDAKTNSWRRFVNEMKPREPAPVATQPAQKITTKPEIEETKEKAKKSANKPIEKNVTPQPNNINNPKI
ncbi:hypothetical protein ACFLQN_01430 [Candidatus Aenigmatarchaeota archaeon]